MQFYRDEAGDPRVRGADHDPLADFLESDVQGSAVYAWELLGVVDRLLEDDLEEWARGGNAYYLTLTPETALLEHGSDDAPAHEVPLHAFRDAVAGWLEFLESGGRPS